MALEAVVSSKGLFGCWAMAASGGGGWSGLRQGGGVMEGAMKLEGGYAAAWEVGACSSLMMPGPVAEEPLAQYGGNAAAGAEFAAAAMSPLPAGRRKRCRARSVKNKEEAESQRMTHIAVERNRRKQMNEYLAVLRSVMPPSYVQRGDQASIIGGAINYVKELEQQVQALEARRHARSNLSSSSSPGAAAPPFAAFFTFPQYSMSAAAAAAGSATATNNAAPPNNVGGNANDADGGGEDDTAATGSRPSSVADIEVTMVESHANLRVLSRRRPRQLLRVVAGLQAHRLTVLHLNVASAGSMALYSLSLKVEDDCRLSSVDDIAAAVHRIVEALEHEETKDQQFGGELGSSSSETDRNSSRV